MTENESWLVELERQPVSAAAGGILLVYALWRRSWESLLAAPVGGALLYYGLTGQNPVITRQSGEMLDDKGIEVRRAVTIRRSPQEVYEFWRKLENLPRFMSHLERVVDLGEGHSRWQARSLPGGVPLSWEARITVDEPGRLLAWETLPGGNVIHRGSISFERAGADEGTELHVQIVYAPPGGVVTSALAGLLGNVTSQQIKEEIRHCKQIMEAGEIPTTEGQPSGRETA